MVRKCPDVLVFISFVCEESLDSNHIPHWFINGSHWFIKWKSKVGVLMLRLLLEESTPASQTNNLTDFLLAPPLRSSDVAAAARSTAAASKARTGTGAASALDGEQLIQDITVRNTVTSVLSTLYKRRVFGNDKQTQFSLHSRPALGFLIITRLSAGASSGGTSLPRPVRVPSPSRK